jgi:photosystem II stability/assembly factor-like uncharacterized protein
LLSITIGSCYSIESDCDFYWERTNGPRAHSIVVASNGDIWTGTVMSEIFLSTDNGNTWVQKNDDFLGNLIYSIAINPINGYIFYGTAWEGLFRSTDNGESWVNVISNLVDVYAILITPSGEIYFGSAAFGSISSKIYYSNDNGDTWIERSNGLPDRSAISSLALGTDGTLYAGTFYRGVYRSTDNGNNWLPPSNYNNNVYIRGLTICDDGSILATAEENGVLKSTNKGVTWSFFYNVREAYVSSIIYNSITRDIFVGTTLGDDDGMVYRSTNLGAKWELKNNGIPKSNAIHAFAFNSHTGQMYVTTGNGVYRSRNYPEQQKK